MTERFHTGSTMIRLMLGAALLCGSAGASAADIVFSSTDRGVCDVHLIQPDGTLHRVAACGSPVATQTGDLAWLERAGNIASEIVPVGAAARTKLTLPAPTHPKANLSIDLVLTPEERRITVLSRASGAQSGTLFTRDVPVDALNQPIAVPGGEAVVVVFDAAGDVTRHSMPVRVALGSSTTVRPHAETAASALAFLEFPEGVPVTNLSIELAGDSRRAPAAVFQGATEAIALWTGIAERRATVNAQSKELLLEPQEIAMRAGRVTTLRAALSARPKITVAVDIDEENRKLLDVQEMKVALMDSHRALLREAVLSGGLPLTIDELPADVIRVVLSVGKMKFQRIADLRSAREADVRFPLVPLVLSGTVYLGDDPVVAELQFRREGVAPVKTDPAGRYEITLWEPGPVMVEITLRDERDALPYSELRRVDKSDQLDFRIPLARAHFDVTDAVSRAPVEGARILLKNIWQEPAGKRSTVYTARTDKDGRVHTPRLRSGTLEVRAEADGYRAQESLTFPIDDATDATFPIALDPSGQTAPVKIYLSDGRPAARASVSMVTASGQVLFSGTADTNGSVEVPQGQPTDLLLVSHADAGATVVHRTEASRETAVRLKSKGPPFSAQVVRSDGASARAGAVYAWIDGVRLGGTALALLTGTSPATQSSGLWETASLPAAPLTILITTAPADRVNAGLYDSLATTIAFPWSGVQTIRIVE